MNDFRSTLSHRWRSAQSLLCVGLDPDLNRLPAHLKGRDDAFLVFCRQIVDATADLVCAFKPQIAYFAAQRAEDQLEALIAHIHEKHPGVPVILDAKRGDIGSTSEQYAREAFERYQADAVTVQPYQGLDAIAPYLNYAGRGVFVLCRTSNSGGDELQMLEVVGTKHQEDDTERLYERVARIAAQQWNRNGQLGLVVGATYPAELARVRALVGDMPLLVPGIGAQGGDVQATVTAGQITVGTDTGAGMAINSSRAILYAGSGEDFAEHARAAALKTRNQINAFRAHV